MKFGLMFFASSEEALSGNKYQLVMESARFADANGFSSVWVPERHFTEFGSLYPNPAVLHAALAAATQRVKLVAGSVVAALHNPIRIAEEWSMVDNLSNGRVGVSFASGWNPDDFVFAPDKYATRQDDMLTTMRAVQHLWRGGTLDATNGVGKPVRLRVYPTPVQPELPVWVTAASNPQTFVRAGEAGANLLTHVLDQDRDQLAHKIALYREARAKHGFDPAAGTVSVMLHTFVGDDAAQAREQARVPFCNYIRSNIGLLNGLAQSRDQSVDVRAMGARELDEFVEFLYERFAQSRGLIGTPETCVELVRDLESIGVDEVACLLDFGPPVERILGNLPQLRRLREMCAPGDPPRRRDSMPPRCRPAAPKRRRARTSTAKFGSTACRSTACSTRSGRSGARPARRWGKSACRPMRWRRRRTRSTRLSRRMQPRARRRHRSGRAGVGRPVPAQLDRRGTGPSAAGVGRGMESRHAAHADRTGRAGGRHPHP